MLIIPLEKSIDWKRPPVITILLIVINTFILADLQSDDDRYLEEAVDYYFESALPELELTAYLDMSATKADTDPDLLELQRTALERHLGDNRHDEQPGRKRFDKPDDFAEELNAAGLQTLYLQSLLMSMEGDEDFMARLRTGKVIDAKHPRHAEWRQSREKFEAQMNGSITWRYGFIPNRHAPVNFLTHMFLHGGYGHLIGNMLFLFLIGFALEMALGAMVYLGLYVLGGLGAVCLFWAIYPDSTIPLVGASGAIAGLMGLYATLFGLRKIRFFYFVFVYFDYIRAPALIMLPLWLANEFYQLYWGGVSNVAYMAHIGGLISGGVFGLLLNKTSSEVVDTEFLDESTRADERVKRLEEGRRLLGKLDLDRAKAVFSSLHQDYPEDKEILWQLYGILKHNPASVDYQQLAKKILTLAAAGQIVTDRAKVPDVFNTYAKAGKGKLTLSPLTLGKLAMLFAKWDYPREAELIAAMLLRKSPQLPVLPSLLLALGFAWDRASNPDKGKTCLKLLLKHFPKSREAASAHSLLQQSRSVKL